MIYNMSLSEQNQLICHSSWGWNILVIFEHFTIKEVVEGVKTSPIAVRAIFTGKSCTY